VRWLSETISSEENAAEEHQLRLERDDRAVKLVTIHKSKGLEYPVVFCPFSWKSSDLRRGEREPVFFHERPRPDVLGRRMARQFICDLGTENVREHRELAVEERLAENLRLLYVALTRARNRCYLVWGAFRGAGTSAAAWLLHPAPSENRSVREVMNAHFKSLTDVAMQRDLERLVERSVNDNDQPSMLWQELPSGKGEPYRPIEDRGEPMQPRSFNNRIARDWRILSFSGLTADRRQETPDYDAANEAKPGADEPGVEAQGIFAFPRGSRPGTCLHKILEVLDFTQRDESTVRALVREKLAAHGFAPGQFADAVCNAVRKVLLVPLTPGRPDFVLANVPMSERLNELEFFFPVDRLSPALLQSGFARAGGAPEFKSELTSIGAASELGWES
jgi:exodeoxyribonuclease V beta subunit